MKINKEFIKKIIAELQHEYSVDLSIAAHVANQILSEGYDYTDAQQAKADFIETLRQVGALSDK